MRMPLRAVVIVIAVVIVVGGGGIGWTVFWAFRAPIGAATRAPTPSRNVSAMDDLRTDPRFRALTPPIRTGTPLVVGNEQPFGSSAPVVP